MKGLEGLPHLCYNCPGQPETYIQKESQNMPYITIESGALSDEQKEQLIARLTEVSSEIMKVPKEFFVTTIKELPDKNFGIGGKTIDRVIAEYKKAINKAI